MRPKILIITPNALHNGPRLIREIDALKTGYEITAIGATPPHDPAVKYIPFLSIHYGFIDKVIKKGWRILFNRPFLWNTPVKQNRIHRLLQQEKPDIVIAHYPTELPYLFSFPNRKFKVVYNAHEYHPLEFDSNPVWMNLWGKLYTYIYRKYLNKVDLLINVCESIALKCEQEFGKQSLVVPNAASYHKEVVPQFYTGNRPVRMIHHGGAVVDRKIELMIEAVAALGVEYELDLMLIPSHPDYYHRLMELAAKTNNVNIIKPVSFKEIVPFINQYDIGLYNLPANNFNEKVALPNKFFEYIQARLCIVVGPSVEMKNIVEKYDLGRVTGDFTAQAIVEELSKITRADINKYKQNAHKAASQLSAEYYQGLFVEEIHKLT